MITLQLTDTQVAQVMREVTEGEQPSLAILIARWHAHLAGYGADTWTWRERIPEEELAGLSLSLLHGATMLAALPRDGTPIGIKALTERIAAPSPSTTHRYIRTLVALGWAEQSHQRQYQLALALR